MMGAGEFCYSWLYLEEGQLNSLDKFQEKNSFDWSPARILQFGEAFSDTFLFMLLEGKAE
jgi:hypothetical protein